MTRPLINFPKCNLVTRSYWIIHGMTQLPKCEQDGCNHLVGTDLNINFKHGYAPFCTTSCALKQYNQNVPREKQKCYRKHRNQKRPIGERLDNISCQNLSAQELKSLKAELWKDYIDDYCKKVNQQVIQELHNAEVKQQLELMDVEDNPYFKDNSYNFLLLKELVEKFPRSYSRKLNAVGTGFERKYRLNLRFAFLKDWIDALLPQLQDHFYAVSTKVGWILHGLVDFPMCKTCGKHSGFVRQNVNPFSMYACHCSNACGANDIDTICKTKHTSIQRYGEGRLEPTMKTKQTRK